MVLSRTQEVKQKLSVTRTYRAKLALAGACAAALATGLFTSGSVAQGQASVEPYISSFHSFVPAQPTGKSKATGSTAAWQEDMRGARRAWREGRYAQARELFSRALKNGNVTAAWYLGHLYRTGRGGVLDKGKAFHSYRRVWLEYNSLSPYDSRFLIAVDSLVRVADGYRDGIKSAGIGKNPNRAYNLYLTASGFNHPGAEHGLAMMFLKGDGVRQKPKRALGWLRSAARKGYAPSRTVLGDLHWQGRFVRKDRVRAIMWYLLAQNSARPEDYPQVYKRLDAMLAKASPSDQQAAEALASEWQRQFSSDKALLPVAD